MASSRPSQDVEVWKWVHRVIRDNAQADIGGIAVDFIEDMQIDATDLFEILAKICDPTDIFDEKVLEDWVGDN